MSANFTTYSGGLDHIETAQDYLNETIEKVESLEDDTQDINRRLSYLDTEFTTSQKTFQRQDNLLLKIHNNFEAKVRKVAIIICIILVINSITLCVANAYKQHQINELKAQIEEIKYERERE